MSPQPIGAFALILNNKDEVLLGKRKNSYKAGLYGAPGGRIEADEAVESGVVREVLEETHLQIRNLEYIGTVRERQENENETYTFIHFVFVARDFEGEPETAEPDKCEGWEWHSLTNLPKNIIPGHKGGIDILKSNGLLSYRDLL